ncbi:MAG: GAF domain-containing protein [Nodosilinea sp.]
MRSSHPQAQSTPPLATPATSPGALRWSQIEALGLGDHGSIPVFGEAIQLATQFLQAPLGWVSVADGATEYLKATYGLSCLGLGNALAQQRQLPLTAGVCSALLESERPLVGADLTQHSTLSQRELVTTYGVVACCAVPLITTQHQCIGTLLVMDLHPRSFSAMEVSFLAMAARWAMGEYERTQATHLAAPALPIAPAALPALINTVRLNLLGQLTQDLRSPLTTVLGMTSMLSREIYGPLTEKQREYTDIVRCSSQTLITLVDEMIELSLGDLASPDLVPTPVDLDKLGSQVVAILEPLAEKRGQTLAMTVAPGENRWILDQRTVKQVLYHAVFSVIAVAGENSTVRVHASRRGQTLALTVGLSNPWLGEGLPPVAVQLCHALGYDQGTELAPGRAPAGLNPDDIPQPLLGLLLSQRLAEHHGGHVKLHGNAETGYRFVIVLPTLTKATATKPEEFTQA